MVSKEDDLQHADALQETRGERSDATPTPHQAAGLFGKTAGASIKMMN